MSRGSDAAELAELDRLSARAWLDGHGFDSPLLRWYVEYACRDDYGSLLEQTSAWAMLFYFAARRLDTEAESAPFLTWPEGNGRIVSHLARIAGSRLQTGRLVSDVVPRDDHVELAVFDRSTRELVRYVADHVILAVPKFVARYILRPYREAPPAHLNEFTYGAWFVANLHLKRRPQSRGYETAWDNVLYDSPSLGYVVATHQRSRDYGPTVWTYYRPMTGADAKHERQTLAGLDHRALCDAVVSDLSRAHSGLEDAIERIDVWRWGHAMVRPTPGFVFGGARRKAAEPLRRVHFAHADLSGVALFEEAQDRGIRAAEAVLAARGRSFEALAG